MSDTTFEHNGVSVSGYIAEPSGDAKGGLIVIQEWWGLNDDIKGIADRYAAEGFVAFAPDIYHGDMSTEPDEARKLAMALDRDIAGRELDAAIEHLKAEHGVAKVGSVGYCMGGSLTLSTATRPTSTVDAIHAYYGAPRLTPDEIASISVPVMGSYGSEDQGIPAELVNEFQQALDGQGTPNDIKIYEGAAHSFFNAGPAHHEEASQDSWARSVAWFTEHLA